MLPLWQPDSSPVLVIAPHPDDETLGAGALIATLRASNVPVTVVTVTDGENCYDVAPEEREHIRYTRTGEQTAALARLGVGTSNTHRLHLEDSGLHLLEDELTAALMRHATPGMRLMAPWIGDFHPDHVACARAAAAVAQAKGLPLTSYFFWTWHRGEQSVLDEFSVRRFMPEAPALRAKSEALACHTSQLHRSEGEPILPARLLGPAYWPFEIFLPS